MLEAPPGSPEPALSPPFPWGRAQHTFDPELTLSPQFALDGLALFVAEGRLHRTDDFGATWRELEPAPGRKVQQVAFSPDFARDRLLFLAAVSGGFPGPVDDRPHDRATTDHQLSLGVMISADGGLTWTPSSEGLEVDGVPYRHVQALVPSPTFAEDGTLFALAWGPRAAEARRTYRFPATALFRSRDRGTSWERVPVANSGNFPLLTLSPAFAADGVALLAQRRIGISPADYGCEVVRTNDGGDTWRIVWHAASYESCGRPLLLRSEDRLTALLRKMDWRVSTDGAPWRSFSSPWGRPSLVVPSPNYWHDRTLFVSLWNTGLWTFRPIGR